MDDASREFLTRAMEMAGDHQEPPAHRQDLGLLGRVFGGRYASTNIAGLVAVVMMIMLAIVWYTSRGSGNFEREFVTGAFSLITLVLGYLFGSARARV